MFNIVVSWNGRDEISFVGEADVKQSQLAAELTSMSVSAFVSGHIFHVVTDNCDPHLSAVTAWWCSARRILFLPHPVSCHIRSSSHDDMPMKIRATKSENIILAFLPSASERERSESICSDRRSVSHAMQWFAFESSPRNWENRMIKVILKPYIQNECSKQ